MGGVPDSKQPGPTPKNPETKIPDTTVPDPNTPDTNTPNTTAPPAPKPSNVGLIVGALALAVAGFVGVGYAAGMFDD